jgi:hypothetical protein
VRIPPGRFVGAWAKKILERQPEKETQPEKEAEAHGRGCGIHRRPPKVLVAKKRSQFAQSTVAGI